MRKQEGKNHMCTSRTQHEARMNAGESLPATPERVIAG